MDLAKPLNLASPVDFEISTRLLCLYSSGSDKAI